MTWLPSLAGRALRAVGARRFKGKDHFFGIGSIAAT